MIDRIIEFSGRNRFVVFVLVGAAAACGLVVACAPFRSMPFPT